MVKWDASKYAQLMIKKKNLASLIDQEKAKGKDGDTHRLADLHRQFNKVTKEISDLVEARGR